MITYGDRIKTSLGMFYVMGYDSLDEEYWLLHIQPDMDDKTLEDCVKAFKADIAVSPSIIKEGITNGSIKVIPSSM